MGHVGTWARVRGYNIDTNNICKGYKTNCCYVRSIHTNVATDCYYVRSIHTNVATDCLKDVHANVRGSKVLSKLVH